MGCFKRETTRKTTQLLRVLYFGDTHIHEVPKPRLPAAFGLGGCWVRESPSRMTRGRRPQKRLGLGSAMPAAVGGGGEVEGGRWGGRRMDKNGDHLVGTSFWSSSFCLGSPNNPVLIPPPSPPGLPPYTTTATATTMLVARKHTRGLPAGLASCSTQAFKTSIWAVVIRTVHCTA